MNKQGYILDIIVFVIMAFVIIMFFGLYYYGHGLIKDKLVGIEMQIGTGETNFTDIVSTTIVPVHEGLNLLKTLTFVLIFGMVITIFLSNFLVRVHPAFFILYLFVIISAVILSAYISNSYETFLVGDYVFSSTLQEFTATNFIMLNLPIWTTIVGLFGTFFLMAGILRDNELGGPI